MRSYLDIIHLGQHLCVDGVLVDDLVGDAEAGIGLEQLAALLPQLDAIQLEAVRKELESLVDVREPISAVKARDRIVSSFSEGWTGRLMEFVEEALYGDSSVDESVEVARARSDVLLRLTLAEAAVRRYILIVGRPPESLEALLPEYLTVVPKDAFGDGTLVFRPTERGYLLYSVGGNEVDDGGQRNTIYEAVVEEKGDLFFDADATPP